MVAEYEKIQNIPLDVIDEPSFAVRSRISEDGIRNLADDIKLHRLIHPIILRPKGKRFEIAVGNRRYLAFKLLAYLTIPSIVRCLTDTELDIIRLAENFEREDVNVVDEAKFLAGLLERHKFSVQKLAEMINRSETYIRERIDMVNWDPLILDYLYEDKIIFTAAKYLAQIGDEAVRRSWLDIAVRCGITVQQAASWLDQYKKGALPVQPGPEVVGELEKGRLGVVIEKECVLCGKTGRIEDMTFVYVHKDCEEYTRYQRKFGQLPESKEK